MRRASLRRSSRSTLPVEFHLGELDDDVDEIYASMAERQVEMRREMQEFNEATSRQVSEYANDVKSIKSILIGLLVSLATMSILFAANLILRGFE